MPELVSAANTPASRPVSAEALRRAASSPRHRMATRPRQAEGSDMVSSHAPPSSDHSGNEAFRQIPQPGERVKCSAWAKCLQKHRATAIEPGPMRLHNLENL